MRLSGSFIVDQRAKAPAPSLPGLLKKIPKPPSGDIRRESTPIASAKQSSHGATQGSADLSV